MADFKTSYFDILQDYIHEGSKKTLTDLELEYLNVLLLLNNLRRKYGKESALSFVQNPPLRIKYSEALRMYDESINLFYSDDRIEQQTYRNMIFQDLLSAAKVVLQTATCPEDMKVFGDLMTKAYTVKGLDKQEPAKVPKELFDKPYKVYSLDPEDLNLTLVNRKKLGVLIDSLEIDEGEKSRLKQEGQVEDINFLDLLDEQTQKTSS